MLCHSVLNVCLLLCYNDNAYRTEIINDLGGTELLKCSLHPAKLCSVH